MANYNSTSAASSSSMSSVRTRALRMIAFIGLGLGLAAASGINLEQPQAQQGDAGVHALKLSLKNIDLEDRSAFWKYVYGKEDVAEPSEIELTKEDVARADEIRPTEAVRETESAAANDSKAAQRAARNFKYALFIKNAQSAARNNRDTKLLATAKLLKEKAEEQAAAMRLQSLQLLNQPVAQKMEKVFEDTARRQVASRQAEEDRRQTSIYRAMAQSKYYAARRAKHEEQIRLYEEETRKILEEKLEIKRQKERILQEANISEEELEFRMREEQTNISEEETKMI